MAASPRFPQLWRGCPVGTKPIPAPAPRRTALELPRGRSPSAPAGGAAADLGPQCAPLGLGDRRPAASRGEGGSGAWRVAAAGSRVGGEYGRAERCRPAAVCERRLRRGSRRAWLVGLRQARGRPGLRRRGPPQSAFPPGPEPLAGERSAVLAAGPRRTAARSATGSSPGEELGLSAHACAGPGPCR